MSSEITSSSTEKQGCLAAVKSLLNNPLVVKVVTVGSLTYAWVDIGLDVVLADTLLKQGHPIWGCLSVTFITVPQLFVYSRVVRYVQQNHNNFLCPAILLGLPALPLLDVMAVVVVAAPNCMDPSLVAFLPSYLALKTVSEAVGEALPETLLQSWILANQDQGTRCTRHRHRVHALFSYSWHCSDQDSRLTPCSLASPLPSPLEIS